uniref:Protein-glutamine gamma-glutamyltransferase 2 n=1 Tax=Amphiprion ocellaris TaxID=80972 RepID=A0AAQ5XQ13_AMPOC
MRLCTQKNNFTADMSGAVEIERCDLDVKTNSRKHHTELFGEERLIVRRGQPFTVILHLSPGSKEFTPGGTGFTLIVETGPLPRKESDTKASFTLSDSTSETEWSASATSDPSRKTVSVSIASSPNAPIGLYSLEVDQDGQKTSLGQFILLFNAWCPGDAVHMRSETKRQEYVLAQHGQVYRGTHKRIKGSPWNFGQFEAGILDICLKILDDNPKFVSNADQDCSGRRNPVYVSRVLSAMINSNNDRGVLVGEWGEFSGGVHPGVWIGSGDILRQWAESGPVRYGQCWVFAAVACTVSRALGIPCRVVTNFGSAHDTDANLVIENLYDEDGKRISGGDSVWNFHVWVDSWMTRPDLGQEFDGWQTSDPTPQETSEGVFCCGPAPVKAIKEGELTKKYDAPFIFAEVNADVMDLVQLSNGEFVKFSGSTKSVGRFISTKAVGSDDRHDITHQYKYPEGSKEERQVYEKAQHHNKLQQRGAEPGLHLKVWFSFHCSCMYKGWRANTVNIAQFHVSLDLIFATLLGEATLNQKVAAELTLLNPLPEPLQDCSFTIEGVGLTDSKPITADPKQEAKASIEFTPSTAGSCVLLGNFDSNRLKNIKSFINVTVKESNL